MSQDAAKPGKHPLRLGKYEVLSRIGKGGMGTVYRAIDTESQRLVALKILAAELAGKPVMIERFRREARSAARLRHDNIVAIYECGEQQGVHFLALEYVDGKDLHHYIASKGKLSPAEARAILIQAARALDHAHGQGVVHRDIKPSNFLIAHVGSKLQVKLTDMGLALAAADEEARLTKDHSTVGTVDYMAPEQANNSRAADIRSDIYSLGCTFYHMLAGHAPYPKGSIPERIIAHMKVEAPDIRGLNDEVPEDLVRVLKKMLAKKPSERYQTPAELLGDLETETIGLQPLEEDSARPTHAPLPADDGKKDDGKRPVEQAARPMIGDREKHWLLDQELAAEAAPRQRRPRRRDDAKAVNEPDEAPAPGRNSPGRKAPWPLYAALAAGAAVVVAVVVLATRPSPETAAPKPTLALKPSPTPSPPDPAPRDKSVEPEQKKVEEFVGPPPPALKPLYRPSAPLDRARLRAEFAGSGAVFDVPNDAPAVVWRRAAGEGQASTLAEALARLPEDAPALVEIRDNGPIWLPSTSLAGRSLYIRAAAGYRPLIAWDLPAAPSTADRGGSWISCRGGSLVLEGVDLVVKADDWPAAEADLFALDAASLHMRDCTISLSGKQASLLTICRAVSSEKKAMTFSRCYFRGQNLRPVRAEGDIDIAVEGSLFVGGGRPLFDLINQGVEQTTLRLVRTTLVSAHNAICWTTTAKKGAPRLRTLAWDALIARSELSTPQGDMVVLAGGAEASCLSWRGVNCLYAGWKQLLSAPDKKISSGSISVWRTHFGAIEGEEELHEPWPPRLAGDLGDLPISFLNAAQTGADFAATSGRGGLGCDVGALDPGPADWLPRTYDRFPVHSPPLLEEAGPPAIAAAPEGYFAGDRIDINKTDLGLYLETTFRTKKPAEKVVLHLTGRGKAPSSPIRLRGIRHLVVYFESTAKGKEEPLTLIVKAAMLGKESALFDMEGGRLDLIHVRIFFPDSRTATLPALMLHLKDVELRMKGCVLHGPHERAPDAYKGMIRCELARTGEETPAAIVAQDCVFLGHRLFIDFAGANATLRLRNNLFCAGDDAIHLAWLPVPRPRLAVLLENNTVAVRRRFLTMASQSDAPAVTEPMLVQATQNYFVDPFAEEPRLSTVLCVKAEELAQGSILWRGSGNALEEGRWSVCWSDPDGAASLRGEVWRAVWGSRGEQQYRKVDPAPTAKNFPADAPIFDRLLQPPPYRLGVGAPPFGADLFRLGLLRKKA